METMDVWLVGRRDDAKTDPIEGIARVFGLSATAAVDIARALPRVVKRRVERPIADKFARTLAAIGWRVEVLPSRPALELAPGARPSVVGAPVSAAHPVSLPPFSMSTRPPAPVAAEDDRMVLDWMIDEGPRDGPTKHSGGLEMWVLTVALIGFGIVAKGLLGF